MFTTGWAFQFVGHVFEGKKPSFVGDKRNLVVGLLWWMKKSGVPIQLAGPVNHGTHTPEGREEASAAE